MSGPTRRAGVNGPGWAEHIWEEQSTFDSHGSGARVSTSELEMRGERGERGEQGGTACRDPYPAPSVVPNRMRHEVGEAGLERGKVLGLINL